MKSVAPSIGVPGVAFRNNCTSASRLPDLPGADVAATRRLERIHVRQLFFRHCFYEGSSNLGLQSVRNRSCRTYASPFSNASRTSRDAQIYDTTHADGPANGASGPGRLSSRKTPFRDLRLWLHRRPDPQPRPPCLSIRPSQCAIGRTVRGWPARIEWLRLSPGA